MRRHAARVEVERVSGSLLVPSTARAMPHCVDRRRDVVKSRVPVSTRATPRAVRRAAGPILLSSWLVVIGAPLASAQEAPSDPAPDDTPGEAPPPSDPPPSDVPPSDVPPSDVPSAGD